jgi:hypothetical protein
MRPHLNPPLRGEENLGHFKGGEENLILNIELGILNKEQSLIPPPLRGMLEGVWEKFSNPRLFFV